jgi:hypothetical protein
MDDSAKLSCLLDLAQDLGVEVRKIPDSGSDSAHPGGSVIRLKGRSVIFLDPSAGLPDQLAVIASALASRAELQDRFLPPEVRQLLESAASSS